MTSLYVLDVDDFRPLAEAAAHLPHVAVVKRGPYYEVTSDGPIEIARAATGCRNAVWYSCVAGVRSGRVGRWDKAVLRIEPTSAGGPPGPADRASVRDLAAKERVADLGRDVT